MKFRSFEVVASGWSFQVFDFLDRRGRCFKRMPFFIAGSAPSANNVFQVIFFPGALRAIGTREHTRCGPRVLHRSASFIR